MLNARRSGVLLSRALSATQLRSGTQELAAWQAAALSSNDGRTAAAPLALQHVAAAGWRAASTAAAASPGFAGIPGLRSPADWHRLARDAVAECEALVGEALRAPPSAAVVRLLDDISDVLCQVLDAAEFCRNVHADADWRQHAQQTCIELGGYVQELNNHFGIYTALVRALEAQDAACAAAAAAATPSTHGGGAAAAEAAAGAGGAAQGQHLPGGLGFSAEALLVGRMLRRDFERYGVHLPAVQQDAMAAAMQRAQRLGMAITQAVTDPARLGVLELRGTLAGAAQRLPLNVQKRLRPLAPAGGGLGGGGGGPPGLAAPADTPSLHTLLRTARDEDLRRAAFEKCQRTPASNLAAIDALVEARHEVATLMGFPSYASYQLDGFSLAGTPGAVDAFLHRLAADVAPRAAQEAGQLRAMKRRLLGGGPLHPWDRQFLASAAEGGGGPANGPSGGGGGGLAEALAAAGRDLATAAKQPFAEEGSSAHHLDRLPDYFELERVVEGLSQLLEQLMGVRLEERPLAPGEGWAPGVRKLVAVHHADGELGVVYLDLYRRPHKFPSAAHFNLRCGRALPGGGYQTPVVGLVANMAPHVGLAITEVELLFHEFGHALHALLSRTEFQHLSGTRGPLDMVEVPSHTFELLASDPRVLSLFARHRATGEPLPAGLLAQLGSSRRRFAALDLQQQLQYCLIDQLLHGPEPPTGAAAETAVADIMRQHSALGHADGCHPHIRFTHLVGYGATYYSYLFAQSLAARVWQDHLAADPTSRAAGELLRARMLQPGGAKEAHRMVEDILSAHSSSSSSGGDGGGSSGSSGSDGGGLCCACGGFYPDPSAMLRQEGLLE